MAPIKTSILKNLEKSISQMLVSHTQQIVFCVLEFIFLGEHLPLEITTSDFKCLLVQYIDKIHKHFQQNKDHTLINIVSREMKNRKYEMVDQQEGFLNTEEEELYFSSSIHKEKSGKDYSSDPDFRNQKVLDTLTQKDVEIQNLIIKLESKERKILDLANGYLKDLQNMREQLFRKSDDFDYYEVQYFDITDIEDPKYRELVNNKISDLKSQYEKRTREQIALLKKQKKELQQCGQLIQSLEQKTKNLDNVEYLIAKVSQCTRDPYQIWKIMSDTFGTSFFFDVFEKQKHSYNIDYRQINKMLMVTKAYDRELEYFKKVIEDQMCVFVERAINQMKEQIQPYEEQIECLQRELDQLKDQRSYTLQQLQIQFQGFQELLKQQQEQYFNQKTTELQTLQKIHKKYYLKLWYIISKMNKNDQLNKELILYGYDNEQSKLESIHFKEMEQKYINLMVDYNLKIEECEQLNNMLKYQQITFDEIISKNRVLTAQLDDWKAQAKNYQKGLQLTIKHIDIKLQPDQLNLEDPQRETTKAFKDRIKEMKKTTGDSFKLVKEVSQQVEKNEIALEALRKQSKVYQSTQTLIQDVSKTLNDAIDNHEYLKSRTFQDPESVRISMQTQVHFKDVQVQTTLESHSIENLFKNNKILQQQNQTLQQELQDSIKQDKQFEKSDYKSDNCTQLESNRYRQHYNPNSHRNPSVDFSQTSHQIHKKYDSIKQDSNDQNYSDIQELGQTQYVQSYRKMNSSSKKGVFNRLFEDSKVKQARIDEMKNKLKQMEKEHWQQIITIIQSDQDSAHLFKHQITSSKHFYQEQLNRNIEVEMKCFPKSSKQHRAVFYFKKFKDFHLNQSDGSDYISDVFKADEKADEMQRQNIKSVVENRQYKGKITFNGLKREDQQFLCQLERNKQKMDFNKNNLFRNTQYSPRHVNSKMNNQRILLNRSDNSCDVSEFNNKQIIKHLQKAYDLG